MRFAATNTGTVQLLNQVLQTSYDKHCFTNNSQIWCATCFGDARQVFRHQAYMKCINIIILYVLFTPYISTLVHWQSRTTHTSEITKQQFYRHAMFDNEHTNCRDRFTAKTTSLSYLRLFLQHDRQDRETTAASDRHDIAWFPFSSRNSTCSITGADAQCQ